MAKDKDLLEQNIEIHQSSSIALCRAIIDLHFRREDLKDAIDQGCATTDDLRQHLLDDQGVSKIRESMTAHERTKIQTLEQSSDYRNRFIPISEIELKKSGFSMSRFIDLASCTIDRTNLGCILFPKLEMGMVTQHYRDIISYTNPVLYLMNRQYKSHNRNIESGRLMRETIEMNNLITRIEESTFKCLNMERTIRKGIASLQSISIKYFTHTNSSEESQSSTKMSVAEQVATLEDLMEIAIGKVYEVHRHNESNES